MDEKMVSFICHEADMTRLERANKRLFVVVIILIVALVGSNIAWIYYENSFEDVVVTQDSPDGNNNYIGEDGYILNYDK